MKLNSMIRIPEKNKPNVENRSSLGTLVVADARASFDNLNSPEKLKESMLKAAKAGKLNIVDMNIHRFEPHGLSGVLILQESHFSVHTWPEHNYMAIDVFTCGEEGDPVKAMEVFLEAMDAITEEEVKIIERGVFGSNGRIGLQTNSPAKGIDIRKK